MSDRGLVAASEAYPERQERRPSPVEKFLWRLAYLPQRLLVGPPAASVIARIHEQAARDIDFAVELRTLRYELRRTGLREALAIRTLALAVQQSKLHLGVTPSAQQLATALLLLRGGRCVEQTDVDSWALAAALAAVVAALAGMPVHLIVVTGYLARRDAEAMRLLFEAFGLSVGAVDENSQEADRRKAYAADVAYCAHREIALDYLRDRLVLKGKPRALRLRTETLTSHNPRTQHLMLRGLQFAIVAEAETILIDAAQTPITISGNAGASQEAAWLAQALQLARLLAAGSDYQVHDGNFVQITDAGRGKLAQVVKQLAGLWQGARRREEIVRLALVADQVLFKDEHYLVAGQNLQVGEEILRARAPEPGDGRLLRMLLEIKEGCNLTGTRETLARIGYQRFFRRYLRCSALSAGARNLGEELWSVYRLRLLRLPVGSLALDIRLPDRLFADKRQAAAEVVARVRELRSHGSPVLIATRTPQGAAAWSELLEAAGISNQRLSGAQDVEETSAFSQIVAPGKVTVAPYFAARGSCVAAAPETEKLGGLRVILVQPLAYPRHLQYLVERCIPRGVPGSVQCMLALDDDLLAIYVPEWWRRPAMPLKRAMLRYCQWMASRDHAHARGELLRMEDYLGDVLAFSGGQV